MIKKKRGGEKSFVERLGERQNNGWKYEGQNWRKTETKKQEREITSSKNEKI